MGNITLENIKQIDVPFVSSGACEFGLTSIWHIIDKTGDYYTPKRKIKRTRHITKCGLIIKHDSPIFMVDFYFRNLGTYYCSDCGNENEFNSVISNYENVIIEKQRKEREEQEKQMCEQFLKNTKIIYNFAKYLNNEDGLLFVQTEENELYIEFGGSILKVSVLD